MSCFLIYNNKNEFKFFSIIHFMQMHLDDKLVAFIFTATATIYMFINQ